MSRWHWVLPYFDSIWGVSLNATRVSWSALFTALRPLVLRAGHQIMVTISSEWWKISTLQYQVCKENFQMLQLNDELFNSHWGSCNICFFIFLCIVKISITIILSSRQTRECRQNMQECRLFVSGSHAHLEKMTVSPTRKISEHIISSINPLFFLLMLIRKHQLWFLKK